MARPIPKAAVDIVTEFEGFRSKAYMPTPNDRPTIGYGSTFYEDGSPVRMGQTITEERARQLLSYSLGKFGAEVEKLVHVPLNDNQFSALVSFVYNVGPANFRTSTLLRLLNAGQYDAVPSQLPRWNLQKGKVINGLTRRRAAEAALWRK